ncbi:hypothetical protein CU098_013347 [Rhizopus stolonifer]|uniref:Xylanolytic transcriptional activator regulatory domain-containing protein n=1 Tax=Rhizopus stolonifer TaxID=4846 RepID=A0A367KWK7_RHIST|nr:hypothetical protein CU098_013347 [Rhizopus stolonifer]
MTLQLQAFRHNRPAYLSPLFFYALFARAASFVENQNSEQSVPFYLIGKECMDYAIYLRPSYQDRPRLSTILALVIMAQHMEQTKKHENLTQAWLWSGEAFRSALDLGVHRSIISSELDYHALRVHIMDAATPNLAEKFNADKNYVYCVETIYKLPQCITNSSILNDSIQDLHEQYQNKAQDISVTQIPLTVTEENKTKAKRKEEQSPTIRQYEHGKKRKKGKPTPKKEKETMKGPSTSEMTEYNTEQQQNFIPDELQYSIDPYQQFYNQLLLQDDGPIPTDYSFDLFSNDVQEYTVGLEDDLGVSIQLVSNKRQQ